VTAAQVGVFGTADGCTPAQLRSLHDVLFEMVVDGAWELHIADAHGAPVQAHRMWRALRQLVVVHPSRGDGERPRLDHDQTRPTLPTRERDLALIRECQAVVVCPTEGQPWESFAVYSAARRAGLALVVVQPSGRVEQWSLGCAPPLPEMEGSQLAPL
jgi:hypothetical protein